MFFGQFLFCEKSGVADLCRLNLKGLRWEIDLVSLKNTFSLFKTCSEKCKSCLILCSEKAGGNIMNVTGKLVFLLSNPGNSCRVCSVHMCKVSLTFCFEIVQFFYWHFTVLVARMVRRFAPKGKKALWYWRRIGEKVGPGQVTKCSCCGGSYHARVGVTILSRQKFTVDLRSFLNTSRGWACALLQVGLQKKWPIGLHMLMLIATHTN